MVVTACLYFTIWRISLASISARLLDLKAKRAEAIYQVETQRIHFGRTIRSMNRAWKGITTATQELRDNLEKGSNGN